MTLTSRTNVRGISAAHEARETHEAFLFFFFSRHPDLLRIDYDDEVAGIDMWGEDRFLFAAQKSGRLHGDVTEHLILGIDQPPFAVDFIGFGGKRLHRRLEKGTEATGRGGDCQPEQSGGKLVLKVLSK